MTSPRRNDIIEFLRTQISARTQRAEANLSNDADLTDLGLKSIDVVLISGEVEDHFGIDVDPIVMFEYRTIHAVADRLVEVSGAT